MATFGTVGASLNAAMRISLERKSGWTRQLRLTALPGSSYVTAKLVASGVTTLPAIIGVFLLGAVEGVRFSAGAWIGTAAILWVGGFVFAALGVALGYAAAPDSVQPIVMITYMLMAMAGGTWFRMPDSIQKYFDWTPMALYNQLGRLALPHVHVTSGRVLALAVYLVVFTYFAARLYQRDRKAA
jgi:ABC-2 type transport system permease protein